MLDQLVDRMVILLCICSASAEELNLPSSQFFFEKSGQHMRKDNWHTKFCIPHLTIASQELDLLALTIVASGFVGV